MNIEDKLESMSPDELEIVRNFLDLLIIKKNKSKTTNHDYQMKNSLSCPRCHGTRIVKNGHQKETQKLKCKDCNKFFSITTNTILSHLTLNYETLTKYIESLIKGETILETSQVTGLSMSEVYDLRIKILSILNNLAKDIILKDEIQVDEKYFRISLKGTRHDKMPRESRKSGSQNLTIGISKEQVCVLIAKDSYDHIIMKVVGNGPASTTMIEKGIGSKVQKGSLLITDSKSSYIQFAKDHSLILKQIPSGKHTLDEIYNLGEINALMNELGSFLKNYNGISTRHLQQYLDLFRFKKIFQYTLEYIKRNKEAYKFCIIQFSTLTSSEIFSIEMPIDIKSVYGVDFK